MSDSKQHSNSQKKQRVIHFFIETEDMADLKNILMFFPDFKQTTPSFN